MNMEQALRQALVYEKRVRDLYAEAAQQVQDEKGKKALEVLVREEQGHLEYLKKALLQWTSSGKINRETVVSLLPPYPDLLKSLSRLSQMKLEPSLRPAVTAEREILRQALQAEHETHGFYQRMCEQLEPEMKSFFLPFVDIEHGHKLIVQAQLDYLDRLGYWFDVREFDLEAG